QNRDYADDDEQLNESKAPAMQEPAGRIRHVEHGEAMTGSASRARFCDGQRMNFMGPNTIAPFAKISRSKPKRRLLRMRHAHHGWHFDGDRSDRHANGAGPCSWRDRCRIVSTS